MRAVAAGLVLGATLGLLAACGSPDPTATPQPVDDPTAPDTREAWEVQWDELQVKAREEGELVIIGGSAAVVYRPLFKFFGDKYGVKVRSSGGSSRQLVDRILAERKPDASPSTCSSLALARAWRAAFRTACSSPSSRCSSCPR